MAPERKDDLRNRILGRARDMKNCTPKVRMQILRDEFKMPNWKLQYYMREPGTDRRRKYPKRALLELNLEDSAAIAALAEKNNTAIENIIRAAERAQCRVKVAPTERQKVEARGYLDWGRTKEIMSHGYDPLRVSDARKTLRVRFNLLLGKPNRLVQRRTGQYCELTLKEQKALLSDPDGFIRRNARDIARRWKREEL